MWRGVNSLSLTFYQKKNVENVAANQRTWPRYANFKSLLCNLEAHCCHGLKRRQYLRSKLTKYHSCLVMNALDICTAQSLFW